jgi:hypothetical protein
MKRKHIVLTIGIVLLSVVIIIGGWYLFVISGAVFSLMPNPPKPEITYGEFPISITVDINGEEKVVEDTVICEFDGVENLGSGGKRRKWKIYMKSTGERMVTLYDLRTSNEFTEWGTQVLELCFDPGNAEYFMGDIGDSQREGSLGKWIDYLYSTPEGETGYSAFDLDEAWEKYKIKIISWKISPPIQNSFK